MCSQVCESALEHKEVDLSCDGSGLLDMRISTVLNANPAFGKGRLYSLFGGSSLVLGSLVDILAPNTDKAVVSDADEQLLIKVGISANSNVIICLCCY